MASTGNQIFKYMSLWDILIQTTTWVQGHTWLQNHAPSQPHTPQNKNKRNILIEPMFWRLVILWMIAHIALQMYVLLQKPVFD